MDPKTAQQIRHHPEARTARRAILQPWRAQPYQTQLRSGSYCPESGRVRKVKHTRSNSRRRTRGLASVQITMEAQRNIRSGTMRKLMQSGGATIGACTFTSQRRVRMKAASSGEMPQILAIGSRASSGESQALLRAMPRTLAAILKLLRLPGTVRGSRARLRNACGRLLALARHEAKLSRPLRGPCRSSGWSEGSEKDVGRTKSPTHEANHWVGSLCLPLVATLSCAQTRWCTRREHAFQSALLPAGALWRLCQLMKACMTHAAAGVLWQGQCPYDFW